MGPIEFKEPPKHYALSANYPKENYSPKYTVSWTINFELFPELESHEISWNLTYNCEKLLRDHMISQFEIQLLGIFSFILIRFKIIFLE